MTEITPSRGDAVEAWLKTKRDEYAKHATSWYALDSLLDDYQLHADCGTPLGEETPDGIPGTAYGVGEPTSRRPLAEIRAERARQDKKWGPQNHPDGTGGPAFAAWAVSARRMCQRAADDDGVTWQLILDEEVAEALAESDPAALRAELVQVAAVCVAWIECLDRRTSDRPLKTIRLGEASDEEIHASMLAAETYKLTPTERYALELEEQGELIDPDCRDGKCGSCVGGPCQHHCHQAGSEAVR